MSTIELTPPAAPIKTPAELPVKAVGPLPPPIVPLPPESHPPKPAPPPAKLEASPAQAAPEALILNPAPQQRVYQPIDMACPHQNYDFTNCGAAEGEPCSWQQTGMSGTFHAERIANAAAASRGSGNIPTQAEFDQAAEDSGLF